MVALANFRHPAPFARELTAWTTSRRLLMLGVGAGGFGYDATVLGQAGLTLRERADRFVEFVELLDPRARPDHIRGRAATTARWTPAVPRVRAATPPAVRSGGQRTARDAAGRPVRQGWVTSGPAGRPGPVVERIATLAARFDDVAAGRRWTGISCWTRRATGRCARAAEFVDEAGGRGAGFHRRGDPLAAPGGLVRRRRGDPGGDSGGPPVVVTRGRRRVS